MCFTGKTQTLIVWRNGKTLNDCHVYYFLTILKALTGLVHADKKINYPPFARDGAFAFFFCSSAPAQTPTSRANVTQRSIIPFSNDQLFSQNTQQREHLTLSGQLQSQSFKSTLRRATKQVWQAWEWCGCLQRSYSERFYTFLFKWNQHSDKKLLDKSLCWQVFAAKQETRYLI